MPGVRIPSFPFGGAIFSGFSMQLLDDKDLRATGRQQMVIRNPDKPVMMSEDRRICKSVLRGRPFTRQKTATSSRRLAEIFQPKRRIDIGSLPGQNRP
jgi:hypothetical protein